MLYDAEANTYLMGWRDFDPTTGRFIVPDTYEGEDDEPTTLNRYLYAEGDPVNNIDPDGNFGKWLQAAWKVTKKAYNFAIGDDIQTLTSPKTKWYQKALAGVSLVATFAGGSFVAVKAVKYVAKLAKARKATKVVNGLRFTRSIKGTKKYKIVSKNSWNKAKEYYKSKSRSININSVAKDVKNWLGKDSRVIVNKNGDKVFISKNGTKRVRFDIKNTSPHNNSHGHVEELKNGRWVKSGPIYPKDVPHN